MLNSQLKTISDNNGYYEVKGLKSGTNRIKVSYVGFESQTIKIVVQDNIKQNIVLQPSTIMSDEVIISAIRASDESPRIRAWQGGAPSTVASYDMQPIDLVEGILWLFARVGNVVSEEPARTHAEVGRQSERQFVSFSTV